MLEQRLGRQCMDEMQWTDFAKPTDIFHISRTRIAGPGDVGGHRHKDYGEVYWVDEGTGTQTLNDVFGPLPPHRLFVLHPGDSHALRARRGEGMLLFNVAMHADLFDFARTRYGDSARLLFESGATHDGGIALSPPQLHRLRASAEELSRCPREQIYIDRFVLELLVTLEPPLPQGVTGPNWLRQACEEFLAPEHFARGVAGLVALAGRSREHVARELRRATGKTPTEFATQVRLDYATHQLTMTADSIETIASDCGFASAAHFYRIFRKRFGVPPRQYRLHHQRGTLPTRD